MLNSLPWLPEISDWRVRLRDLRSILDPAERWKALAHLANSRLDFLSTTLIDKAFRNFCSEFEPLAECKRIRLAILGSSTLDHLLPSIRVGALRRGMVCTIYSGHYGQYLQEILAPESDLERFKPDAILLALDAYHLVESDIRSESPDQAQSALQLLRTVWGAAAERFRCPILQNTLLPVFPSLLGNNEHRLAFSPAEVVRLVNNGMRAAADEFGVHLVALDQESAQLGLSSWHDPSLWHHAKQEIAPAAAPLYGDLIGRLLAATSGRSYKCLVLDLDNTLWGGVVGDDGVPGLVLGQNSAVGEAYVQFQRYVLRLARRGVILAVCSKNDEVNARAPFTQHSEMVLKEADIACFVANWQDKASNLRSIAKTLNIGLDSVVFVDDNPFERAQVRSELPMVAVPELPEDPAAYASLLSAAGYFESTGLTEEDRSRTAQYQDNADRHRLLESSSDMGAYLASLNMKLAGGPINADNLKRATQLINKTNQFNLTTRRYSEDEVAQLAADPSGIAVQLRLVDRFGDSGIICIVIGKLQGTDLLLDSWLMSCRVLGRQVEEATFNIVSAQAIALGAQQLVGEFLPTPKNGMVKNLYERLGFEKQLEDTDGRSLWTFNLKNFTPVHTHIEEQYAVGAYATS